MKVREFLRSQKLAQQRQIYVQGLRDKAKVAVYLEEPASARVAVNSKGFSRGPMNAPVTIVEFSDFECPFCRAVLPTITELMSRYPGKVRWVFRDFPIQSLHPTASKAHEAARCAGEQGKFWEYHDLLFARLPRNSVPALKQYAGELKLKSAAFAECLERGRYRAEVASDLQEGKRLGIEVTPTFFINGRMREGEQSIAALQELIESELKPKLKQ
jgi:protein-disulfide isomerase